ncbi:MAG: ParB/RepB/Spo0J family partition protein [Planctomycetales bacterium]|nr:ParB/RepB/Spo0J family partition protein [Planctomycetales bacterium]
MERDRRLGRGLDLLLARSGESVAGDIVSIPLDSIRPNPRQPRGKIDPSDPELAGLSLSIKADGVLQPILVRKSTGSSGIGGNGGNGGDGYELIAGERRFRAAQAAGLRAIPAIVREADDRGLLRLALVENMQRKDLDPIEKAEAIQALIEDFDLTQDEAAKEVGIERSSIANFIRLLDLPAAIRDAVSRGTITMGHARALLSVADPEQQLALFHQILESSLTVRDVETQARRGSRRPSRRRGPSVEALEGALREKFGTKVAIHARGRGGRIVVHYASAEEFDRLLDLWRVPRE